ncbi:unnamed protein product, partial [marine sediment metagenome]
LYTLLLIYFFIFTKYKNKLAVMYKENILKKLKASKITILKRTVLIAVVVLILVSLLVVSPKKASAITLKEL